MDQEIITIETLDNSDSSQEQRILSDEEIELIARDSGGQKSRGGGCGGGAGGAGEPGVKDISTSDNTPQIAPKTPRFKLEIEENDVPENWWDDLPDFDPRVYDAITMEQAEACVNYIFKGLPDIHELENSIEAKKFRKICPRLKTQVPRTKVIKPKEIKYTTKIDDFIKDDRTY